MPKIFKMFILAVISVSILTACSVNTSKENDETIVVTDVRGEVTIPADPKRIVDLSGNSDILSILGYSVIGTANSDAYDYTKLPTYLQDTLADAVVLGYSYQDVMDVEAIMNLSPDLIIISTRQEKMVDTLSEIAPTVMIQLEALDWQADLRTLGNLFQRSEKAEAWLSDYTQKAKAAGDKIREAHGESITFLSFLASGGQFYVFDGAGLGTVLYNDLGLKRPVGLPQQTDVSLPVVSMEGLASIQAEWFIVISTEADVLALSQNPIWNSLPAVKSNQVIQLPASPYFTQGYSAIGRESILDEVAEWINAESGS